MGVLSSPEGDRIKYNFQRSFDAERRGNRSGADRAGELDLQEDGGTAAANQAGRQVDNRGDQRQEVPV